MATEQRDFEDVQFGGARLDPEAEKVKNEKNADGEMNGHGSAQDANYDAGRRTSTWKKARGSVASTVKEARSSMAKHPGWNRDSMHPMKSYSEKDGEGDVEEGETIDYATLEWWQAGFIMIAETISLGILALPSTLATIGIVPGVILLAGLGVIATYSGYVIGQFALKYPWVHSFGDAGEILFKPWKMGSFGRELFGWAQTIFQIFTMASHILTWTICLNTISDGATCTIVWAVVGLAIFFILDLPRTLKNVSYMAMASFCSIFTAVLVTMITVGIQKPRGNDPLSAVVNLEFVKAFLSVSNIIFAYAGHSCFFGFIAEFKKPKDWPKALALLQICDTSMYITAAVVIYVYAGPNVKSPALGSAEGVMKKFAWGIAIPTIIIAGVIYGHIAAKYIFVRIFRGTKHVDKRTKLSTIAWWSITLFIWVIAFIIAESIPNFNTLLGLISALFASWFTFGIPGAMWLFMNKGEWFKNGKKVALFFVNAFLFTMGLAICILGMWSSGEAIATQPGGAIWTCKSNAE